jgi:hypothetical protein
MNIQTPFIAAKEKLPAAAPSSVLWAASLIIFLASPSMTSIA